MGLGLWKKHMKNSYQIEEFQLNWLETTERYEIFNVKESKVIGYVEYLDDWGFTSKRSNGLLYYSGREIDIVNRFLQLLNIEEISTQK